MLELPHHGGNKVRKGDDPIGKNDQRGRHPNRLGGACILPCQHEFMIDNKVKAGEIGGQNPKAWLPGYPV